jgi:hypothetical protein
LALFKHKPTGAIIERPAHYATHPVFGRNLEPITDKETAEAAKAKPVPTATKADAKVQGGAEKGLTAPEELKTPEQTIEKEN